MKKILITGANSYIGDSVKEYLLQEPYNYSVDIIDTIGFEPKPEDFQGYDVVFNVAGIAHIKETSENRNLYFKVNRDLAVNIAKAAKASGVKQFILLSSMSVYGKTTGYITKKSKELPTTAYGLSKAQADHAIAKLKDHNFLFACLRPPMVYGKGCKGNYQSLRSFALKSPVFPNYDNQRSMIYIGNLCEFVKKVIDEERQGLFFPQNIEYVNTSDMVREIAKEHDKRIKLTRAFNLGIKTIPVGIVKKVFGSLTYEKVDLVDKFDFYRSIKLTECGDCVKKHMRKKILVMMSTYNGEKHLREQINSILNQKTIHEIHLRIRDDGSKDNTCNIIEEYIKKFDGKIELIKGKNIGYNASFFSLIQKAEGYDYYSISDQDDVWLPDKLQIACDAIDKIEKRIPVLYASTSYLVHDDLIPYGTTRLKKRELTLYNTIIQNICPGHTQVMNNRLIELLKGSIDTSRIYVYDSWIQNVANLYGKILFDNEAHTYYRQYEGNQLGSGTGIIGQLFASIKRTSTGDGLKYRRQIEYFVEMNSNQLKKKGLYKEIERFIKADSFIKKIGYIIPSKLYRQTVVETIAFKTAVLFNRY